MRGRKLHGRGLHGVVGSYRRRGSFGPRGSVEDRSLKRSCLDGSPRARSFAFVRSSAICTGSSGPPTGSYGTPRPRIGERLVLLPSPSRCGRGQGPGLKTGDIQGLSRAPLDGFIGAWFPSLGTADDVLGPDDPHAAAQEGPHVRIYHLPADSVAGVPGQPIDRGEGIGGWYLT